MLVVPFRIRCGANAGFGLCRLASLHECGRMSQAPPQHGTTNCDRDAQSRYESSHTDSVVVFPHVVLQIRVQVAA